MYESSVVTFIDILGFRDLVATRSGQEVAKVIDMFRDRSGDPRKEDSLGLRVAAFSDSVIRARPQATEGGLFYELLDLLHAQGELVHIGVLVRGGVALGGVAWDEDKVFGPGFIDAYELESKFAVYPRIAVSPSLLRRFASGQIPSAVHHSLATEAGYVKRLLAQGDDGVWFIDYLRAFESQLDDDGYPDYLLKHREIVLKLADKTNSKGELSSLTLKVNWLAKYHNSVVAELDDDRLAALDCSKAALAVPDDAVRTLFWFEQIEVARYSR